MSIEDAVETGRELVVTRTTEQAPQVRKKRKGGWTEARRRTFLDHLAATCNVSLAVAAAGMNLGGVYTLRRRDPEFRAQWSDALECGYARLETMLIARAAGTEGSAAPDPASTKPPFDEAAHPEATAGMDPVLALEAWNAWAHGGQVAPAGDWAVWMLVAGRGFGKTRAGAEWVSARARADARLRIALVGATIGDVRRVMIEGESGLLSVQATGEPAMWSPSIGRLTFASGAEAFAYGGSHPESLRGPQHHLAWCDELAKWGRAEATWRNLRLGLRLGERPQVLVTTTPRPIPLLRGLMTRPGTVVTGGRTVDNPHLPQAYVDDMIAEYGGTRIGRQELDGELIADVEGSLWPRALIERQRLGARALPEMVRVVIGVDPPGGSGARADACGIVAVGLGGDGCGYVLDDASVRGERPEGWAAAVAAAYSRWHASRVIAEKNQGGEMVESVLRAVEAALPLTLVHASQGKSARAEPVAALYEKGRVFHAGGFAELEDEMAAMTVGGYDGAGSPDRADALVWGMSELMLGKGRGALRIRAL